MNRLLIGCLLLIAGISSAKAQTMADMTYKPQWQQIGKAIGQGRSTDAIALLNALAATAKADKIYTDYIAAIAMRQYQESTTTEKWYDANIAELDSISKSLNSPYKEMLYNMIAKQYADAANDYYYTDESTDDEYSTKAENYGARKRIHDAGNELASVYYWKALADPEMLLKHPALQFGKLLTYKPNKADNHEAQNWQPTLYHLMLTSALEHYENVTQQATANENTFILTQDVKPFSEYTTFVNINWNSSDKDNPTLQILKLYQQGLAQTKQSAEAHCYLDLRRINYVHDLISGPRAYVQALAEAEQVHKNCATADLIAYYRAQAIRELTPQQLQKLDIAAPNMQALALCKAIVDRNRSKSAVKLAQEMTRTITATIVEAQVENILIPNTASLLLIHYRNVSNIILDIRPCSSTLDLSYKAINTYTTKTKSAYSRSYTLPANTDYTDTSTEVILPPLPVSYYLLILRNQANATEFYATMIQVSDLDIHKIAEGTSEVHIVNRTNGESVGDAMVHTFRQEWNNSTRKYKNITVGISKSTVGAFIALPAAEHSGIQVILGKDTLVQSSYHNGRYYADGTDEASNKFATVYTDRGIYRPGQTVKYKSIIVDNEGKAILGAVVKMQLQDANGELLTAQEKTTNEFGSLSGEIDLPGSSLNGRYTITVLDITDNRNLCYKTISVEEYKRPKYKVSFEAVTKEHALAEQVTLTGVAMGYNGAPISNAIVTYSVYRTAQVMRWCFPNFNNERYELEQGTTTTDASGKFTVSYKALGNKDLEKNSPVYEFTTTAKVVDINGEAHEAITVLRLSKLPFTIALVTADKMDLNNAKNKVNINAFTIDGKQVNQQVNLRIQKRYTADKFSKNRLWPVPQHNFITEEEWLQLLPLEERFVSNETRNAIAATIVDGAQLQTNTAIVLSDYINEPGTYNIFIWTVVNGDTIADETTVVITNHKTSPLKNDEVFMLTSDASTITVGKAPVIRLFSRFANLSVSLSCTAYKQTRHFVALLKQGWNDIVLDPVLDTKSNLSIQALASYANRTYTQKYNIDGPAPAKYTTLKLVSFRDKIVPGSAQEITIQINDSTKNDAAFEIVAAMYDASLDQFATHTWAGLHVQNKYVSSYNNRVTNVSTQQQNVDEYIKPGGFKASMHYYDHDTYSNTYGTYMWQQPYDRVWWLSIDNATQKGGYTSKVLHMRKDSEVGVAATEAAPQLSRAASTSLPPAIADSAQAYATAPPAPPQEKSEEGQGSIYKAPAPIAIRKNLQETAFFYPHLVSKSGEYKLRFTAPEALTTWRIMSFAHNAKGDWALAEADITTQKDIMVVPNMPRYVYANDNVLLMVKINNLSSSTQEGKASIQILNAATEADVTKLFVQQRDKTFSIIAGGSQEVAFNVAIPDNYSDPIIVRTMAIAKEHSDGEQNMLPILSHKIQLTESATALLKPGEEKSLEIPILRNAKASQRAISLQLQSTSNPTWHAVQALPYLHNFDLECTEQLTQKIFSLAVAKKLAELNPALQEASAQWLLDSNMLHTRLQSNTQLRSIMLQETPWVSEAKDEQAQLRSLGRLFRDAQDDNIYNTIITKVVGRQSSNGGYAWWPNMQDNEYITLGILESFAQLKLMGALPAQEALLNSIANAIAYCDRKEVARYELEKKNAMKVDWGGSALQYLYVRTMFAQIPASKNAQALIAEYLQALSRNWTNLSARDKATYACLLHATSKQNEANTIVQSLLQSAVRTKARGMYWKTTTNDYTWHNNDIEDHAYILAMLHNTGAAQADLDEICIWLLLNKQNNYWSDTKTTATAIYALLSSGATLQDGSKNNIAFTVGTESVNSSSYKQDKGTGNVRIQYAGNAVTKSMGSITARNSNAQPAWISASYQYLSAIADIQNSTASNAISIRKELFVVTNSNTGESLTPASGNLELGDKVRVRLIVSTNRAMNFVHIKDLRAACFEPKDVISESKYQGNIMYYHVTKDASTNFFVDALPKGSYTIEYDTYVNSAGIYSNGNASIQCMYSPEFTAYGSGSVVEIK